MTTLRDHIQAIYDQYGRLTPQLVVEEARVPDHPLHSRVFDRSPEEAAEAWYRSRAQDLITSVKVVYRKPDGTKGHVRAFHAVRVGTPDNGGFAYEPTEKVVADPFLRKLLMADMDREWRDLKRRYEDFQEFWDLVRRDSQEAV